MFYFVKKALSKTHIIRKAKNLFKACTHYSKRINAVAILLLIIALLLIFNLFTPDRQKQINRMKFRSSWNNFKPKIVQDKIEKSYYCEKEIINPEFIKSIEDSKKCYEEKDTVYFDKETNQIIMTGECKLSPTPATIKLMDKCNKTIDGDKWFWFLGKKLIKI